MLRFERGELFQLSVFNSKYATREVIRRHSGSEQYRNGGSDLHDMNDTEEGRMCLMFLMLIVHIYWTDNCCA